jgi:hypothetical protein
MKRTLFICAILTAFIGTAPAAAVEPAEVSVVGAAAIAWPDTPTPGTTTTELPVIVARMLPSGEAAGMIMNLSPLGDSAATVTCIRVVGDTVYVGGRLRPGQDLYNGEVFAQIALGIRDGGVGGDLVAGSIFRRADIDPCERLSSFPAVLPLETGNFVVRGL